MQKYRKRFLTLRIIFFMNNYFLKTNVIFAMVIFLNIIANFNIGFHQYYEATIVNSSGGTAALSQEYWGLRLANQQLISIAIKKYL